MSASPEPGGDEINVAPLTHKPTFAHVAITPEMAARWLDTLNTSNRHIRAEKVRQYARDMSNGTWTLNNDAICFGIDGLLLNGQHRLAAVKLSGVTVLMGVMRNVPREAMTNMDTGAKRTAGDALNLAGEKNANLLASTTRLLSHIRYAAGAMGPTSKPRPISNAEIAEYISTHPTVRHSVATAHTVASSIDCTATPLATAHALIAYRHGVNGDYAVGEAFADDYLRRLALRTDEPAGSPILALDRKLRAVRRVGCEPIGYVWLLLKAWNALASGRSLKEIADNPRVQSELPAVKPWSVL